MQAAHGVELADELAFLGTPGRLDTVVDTIETHLSWVFLTADRVYKVKKPVTLPYLDHAPLEHRERSCRKELELGRRTAPTVYLGVVPLVVSAGGFVLGGDGEVVDWLVAMRRLPATAMLPHALASGLATTADADALGDVLAACYRGAPRTSWTAPVYRQRMRDLVTGYARELDACGVPRRVVSPIERALLAAIERHAGLLDRRIERGRVVDAHGDLRPEHVCLESPPVVIDPLEFDDDLRTLDAASELAFFTMECDRLGARWFADRVVARYADQAGDCAPPPVVALYQGQHALARAMLALRHLPDVPAADHARWHARAEDYLARAATAAGATDRAPRTPPATAGAPITVGRYATRQPWTIERTATLADAHWMMRDFAIRHLPVVDQGALVGIVTLDDLHRLETVAEFPLEAVAVAEAMTEHPYVVASETPLAEVAETMAAHAYGSAIVTGRDGVEGIFTAVDACRALAELARREA